MTIQEYIEQIKTADEAMLRDIEPAWPKTKEELDAIVWALTKRDHDYGTCVYAMSLSAWAAYCYVAHMLGTTGFQASCADMDLLKRSRHMDVFRIVNADNLLYPQYDEDLDLPLQKLIKWASCGLKEKASQALIDNPKMETEWPERFRRCNDIILYAAICEEEEADKQARRAVKGE